MSILGITALNDIVSRHRTNNPKEILNHLRQSVIETLSQNNSENIHKDGIDLGLCVYNSKSQLLQFAGAGLNLWLVNQKSEPDFINASSSLLYEDYKLQEVKGDLMPVGQTHRMKPFTNHSITINPNFTSIYIATDGFADQIGDLSGKKFKTSSLKMLILKNISLPMNEQREVFESKFDQWKGAHYQIDDFTLLGIRL